MAAGVEIRDEDHGWEDYTRRLRYVKGAVKVGVDDSPHMPTGQPTDEIATFHEFGFGVPERSFLRAWVDVHRVAIEEKLEELGLYYLETGGDWREEFGEWAVAEIINNVEQGIPPPLAPRTLARKGELPALIDSHQLVDAILFELEGSLLK